MRTSILVVALFSAACPQSEEKPEADTKESPAEPEAEKLDAIFGFKSKTAYYYQGKDGAPDTIKLGGVDEKVVSLDGKNEAELLKIIESNLFPSQPSAPEGLEGPEASATPKPLATIAWVNHKTEVALSNPVYSAEEQTLTMDVEITDGKLHEGSLGAVDLKLQDCPDQTYVCAKSTLTACKKEIGPVGTCWNWLAINCLPCHCSEDMQLCKDKNPSCCGKADEPCYPARLGPHGWERYCL